MATLAAIYWEFQKDEFPLLAIRAGASTGTDLLLREGAEDHERRARWAAAALDRLALIDRRALDRQDLATHMLLEREFRSLVAIVTTHAHLRPSLFPLGPDFWLSYWAGATVLDTIADARKYLTRLTTIPAALADIRSALARGTERGLRYAQRAVDCAAAQVRSQVSMPVADNVFFMPLARALVRSDAFAAIAHEGRQLIEGQIYPAFRAFAADVHTLLTPSARDSIACTDDLDGPAFYHFLAAEFTTLDLSPDEVHAIGLAEVERIGSEMLAIARREGFDGTRRLQQAILADPGQVAVSDAALREQIEVTAKRIDERIPEFFGRTPRTTFGVRSIPEAVADRTPPAYAQANPASGGVAGLLWVTSLPARCPRYMVLPLVLHEGWPGHLMHFALVQEAEELPAFRRFGALRYSACIEGWALYSEWLGEEMGLYDTAEKRYGRLEAEMWRAVRLVLDTGIHAKGWSREAAIRYFEEHLALPASTIGAEVDRYIANPGQALSYQIGKMAFQRVRRRAEGAFGEEFPIREFHDALMAAGPVTLPVLDHLIDGWIADRAPSDPNGLSRGGAELKRQGVGGARK